MTACMMSSWFVRITVVPWPPPPGRDGTGKSWMLIACGASAATPNEASAIAARPATTITL
jgi:hypothetical protein